MLGMAVGTLITICTNVELIDGKKIISGDIGIILQCFENSVIDSDFDYLACRPLQGLRLLARALLGGAGAACPFTLFGWCSCSRSFCESERGG